jgi:3-hydroxyisobutyrate dehydrogenase
MQSVAAADGAVRRSIGWIGAGRMGTAMARRLVQAGHDLLVYNRTRAKTEGLVALGAKAVEAVTDLAECDVVFVTVASSDDLLDVVGDDGGGGLVAGSRVPAVVVDCSTVSADASAEARARLAARGGAFLAAPVSGNPMVAEAGRLTMVVSGPKDAFDRVEPYLLTVARAAVYVGEGEVSRLVKLCHNLFLGVTIDALAEVTVLAERGGVARHAFLEFLNVSVMGSPFTRYKSPALVNLEYKPTFTTALLRKDFDLGTSAARELDVPMPVSSLVHQILGAAIGRGIGDLDFAALIGLIGEDAGMQLEAEGVEVDDGLQPSP